MILFFHSIIVPRRFVLPQGFSITMDSSIFDLSQSSSSQSIQQTSLLTLSQGQCTMLPSQCHQSPCTQRTSLLPSSQSPRTPVRTSLLTPHQGTMSPTQGLLPTQPSAVSLLLAVTASPPAPPSTAWLVCLFCASKITFPAFLFYPRIPRLKDTN